MKTKSLSIIFLGALLLALVTCKKEPDPNIKAFEITEENLTAGTNSVTIVGTYSYPGVIDGIKVCVSENGAHTEEFDAQLDGNDFSVTMTGLKPATEYQYHYAVDYGFSKPFNTETKTFTTLSSEKPTVKALEVQRIDSTTYRIKCQVVGDGGTEVTERGICWNTFGDPVPTDDSIRRYEGSAGLLEEYLVRMEHLASGKKYYVRAYAKNTAGKTGLSEEVLDFETEAPTGTSVDIELSCNPEAGGSVDGGGSYEVGTLCTVTAEANTGYTFVGWTENDAQVSSDAEYTFTVTTSRSLVANFTMQDYVIKLEVTPENSGTVTGAGGYNYDEECSLNATPNTGYDFEKWTNGNTTVSTNPAHTFNVRESATYVAHFKIKSYTISVSANPSNGGVVEGGGSYNHGQSCTVTATPAEGFAFTNWTDDGEVVSEVAEYTFTVTSNRSLVANFTELQPDEYSIQVSAKPSNGGTVTGGGTYQQGQQCTVKATPNPGFTFVSWKEDGNSVHDLLEYTFTVERSRVLVARFEAEAPTEYTVNVSADPSEGGTVTGGGTYQQGQQCTVTATVNEGYTFTNWTENGEEVWTSASNTFIVNSDRDLVAKFTIKSYTISASANPSNGGTVSGGGTYNHGQSCTLSATAANGYTFTNWTEGDDVVSTEANYTFTVNGNRTLKANFTVQAPNTYNINVSANPSAGGTVTGGGTYNQGASCTVTATANTGYTFQKWTENGTQVSTSASYPFNVTGNRTLVAHFQVQSYTITATADPTSGGSVTGGGSYNHGESCTLTATPATGYNFVKWTKNDVQVSTNATYPFTVTAAGTYVAHFQLRSYTINASADPSEGGTVTGAGPYNHGASCTLRATAASGYTFIRWTENGTQVSTNATYPFTVTGNRTLKANFTQQTYTVSVSANPTNGGSPYVGSTLGNTSGTYTSGQSCTVHANPASGYTFANWTEGGDEVSTDANYTFTVNGNRTLKANFTVQAPNTYNINVSADPSVGGAVTGGGEYEQGASCTLTATANNGYTFDHWTKNGTTITGGATITFNVTASATYVAHFTQQTYTISTSVSPASSGTVSGGGDNFTYNQSCTLTATANNGYTFDHWTKNGTTITGGATITFNVTASATYVAHFTQQTYTISTSVSPASSGTVSGGGDNFTYNQSCTLTATANSGYAFDQWQDGNTANPRTITVTGNATYTAYFNAQPQAPQGAINGQFTINNSGDKVYFSKGNLQYIGSAGNGDANNTGAYWKFADNQWDCLGTTTGQNSTSQTVDRDLFGWGTSGWSGSGATYYRPWDTDKSDGSLYGPPGQYNLNGSYAQADWGVHNAISNGGGQAGQWRTLTRDEWEYVFLGRSGASSKYGHGKVNGRNGMILLPDEWTLPSGLSFTPGNSNWANDYTTEQWEQMEQNGAVFLPAAGYRDGTSVRYVGSNGVYWSTSYYNSVDAYYVVFNDSNLNPQYDLYRYYGFSVRLVRVAQ